jgi:rubredoxin
MFQYIWICRPCGIIYSPAEVGEQKLTQCPNCAEADLEELATVTGTQMRKALCALEEFKDA